MDEIEMTSEATENARHLAAVALIAFMGDARKTAIEAIQQIDRQCGGAGINLAMQCWVATMADRVGLTVGQPIQLVFTRTDQDGAITGADAVDRPEVVWAGRLAAAYIARDACTYGALLAALPDDPAEVGAHVGAVLEGCALTMRRAGVTP